MIEFDWQLPYSANRQPVCADNVVATSQPLATAAGVAAMRAGGNAVDAALAAAITLTVVEPNNNGLGSDAFALVHDGNCLHGLNGSGRTPAALNPEAYFQRKKMPSLGWHSVTIPGAVNVWTTLSKRFGRLPFADLFHDAVRYADEGFPLGPKTAYFWQRAQSHYADFPDFQKTFFPKGFAPTPGARVRLPDHAKSLQKIRDTHGEAFYRGELASAMVTDANRHEFPLTLEDLDQHQADWVEPIDIGFGEASLSEIPPNGQGLMALIALGILDKLHITHYSPDSAEAIHLQAEAIRYAWRDVSTHLGDPAFMRRSSESFLEDSRLTEAAKSIDPSNVGEPLPDLGASPDTVYLCAADKSGLMVSFIQSNFRGFGSGIVVPNTGISLQNRGSGFVTEIDHPNAIAAGKRPFHTIIPGFAHRQNQPFMSFGVMGGHMQAQGHVQMMIRVLGHGQNPQAASDAPRWHLTEQGDLALESGVSKKTQEALIARGHRLLLNQPEHLFGGAQLIARLPGGGYCAGSDHRKEGLAAGF